MARIAIPTPRQATGAAVYLPTGVFSNHVLKWPNGSGSQPDAFANGVAADLRKFPKWPMHNPSSGSFVWTGNFYDAPNGYYANTEDAVVLWHANGKKVLLVLDPLDAPAWTNVNDDAAFAAWVTAAVTRWQPEAVEFSNEPSSISTDIPWLVNKYAVGKAAAKAAKSDILIVGPSCESIVSGGNGIEYTQDFLNAGGSAHIDVLGVHMYPHGSWPNHGPQNLIQQTADMHAGLDALWSGPIWNTESGTSPEIFYTQTRAVQLLWFWQHNMLPGFLGFAKSYFCAYGEDNYGPYDSLYLADILAMVPIIKIFEGTTAHWKLLDDGRLRVVRHDGAEFVW